LDRAAFDQSDDKAVSELSREAMMLGEVGEEARSVKQAPLFLTRSEEGDVQMIVVVGLQQEMESLVEAIGRRRAEMQQVVLLAHVPNSPTNRNRPQTSSSSSSSSSSSAKSPTISSSSFLLLLLLLQ
jgi:hypothetical protein